MEPLERIRLLANEFGFELGDRQLDTLERYREWLNREAVRAGGIGPNEVPDLLDRHLADALTWLQPMRLAPVDLIDVGSGVGLPGIPLAVALPDTPTTLIDRSGRRCSLLRRAVRVLDLDNVDVRQADVADVIIGAEVVVARASLPPEVLLPHLQRLVGRLGIVAGSTRTIPSVSGYSTVEISSRYLDSPRWLLIMQPS